MNSISLHLQSLDALAGAVVLIQQTPTPIPGSSIWEQPAVVGAVIVALVLIVQALGKDGVSIVHEVALAIPKYLHGKEAERKMKTDAYQQQIDQNRALFEQIKQRDDLLSKVTDALTESQRLSNEQRLQFKQERDAWRDERTQWHQELQAMLESKQVSDTALETVVAKNKELMETNQRLEREKRDLETERDKLLEQLKVYQQAESTKDTGESGHASDQP